MNISGIGPYSSSTVVDHDYSDDRISLASSPGATSSFNSVSSLSNSPPVLYRLEKTFETELAAYPTAVRWAQALIQSRLLSRREVEDAIIYDKENQKLPGDLRAALVVKRAVQTLATNQTKECNSELYNFSLQCMLMCQPNEIPERLVHDRALSDEDFAVFMQLYERCGLLTYNQRTKIISFDPEFHGLLRAYCRVHAAADHFLKLNEHFVRRVESAALDEHARLRPHLEKYVAYPEHDVHTMEYQFLKQFVEGPRLLCMLWMKRDALRPSKSYYEMAEISIQLGQYARAKEECIRAAIQCEEKIQSSDASSKKYRIHLRYAQVCCELGQHDASIAKANELTSYLPVMSRLVRAKNYLYMQSLQDAVIELDSIQYVEKTAEEQFEYVLLLGLVHMQIREIPEAQGYLKEASALQQSLSLSFAKQKELELLQLGCRMDEKAYYACKVVEGAISQELGCAHPVYAACLITRSSLMRCFNVEGADVTYQRGVELLQKLLQKV